MAGYNYAELIRMQNDALRRVGEMNENAQNIARQANAELEMNAVKPTPFMRPKPDQPQHVPMPDDYIRDLREYAKRASLSPYGSEKTPASLTQTLNTLASSAGELPQNIKKALSNLNIDNDRALLLSLILLLAEENADEFLIIALLYMML